MTKQKLSQDKKDFVDIEHIRQCHEDYDKKALAGELNLLRRKWQPKQETIDPNTGDKIEKDPDKKKKQIAHDLYGSARPIIVNHWEALKSANSGVTIICPMCGLSEAEEMDHFAPRGLESFPEYATHYTNLIPLCHNCNHTKGEQWLDNNGDQIFFNAFFDDISKIQYLKCDIRKDPSTELVETQLSIEVNRNDGPIQRRIYDTFIKLNLLDLYKKVTNTQLRRRVNEHISEFLSDSDRYKDIDDYIISKRNLMLEFAKDSANDFLTRLLWHAIAHSDIYWDFIRSQFIKK